MADLDPRQQAAVDAGPIDLFISAGAGSGKTRVLATRFVHAVLGSTPYAAQDPAGLLAVTYTEKAAGDLAERVRRALTAAGRPDAARRVGEGWISTIHGMCARMLREQAFAAGLDPRFTVLDEVDASALELQAFEEAVTPLVASDSAVAALVDAFGLGTVVSAARSIRADVRALGLAAEDVETMPAETPTARLALVAAALEEVAQGLDDLRGLATVRNNAHGARAAAGAIRDGLADSTGLDAAALLARLSALGMRHCRGVDGHEALVDAGKRLLDDALASAAQLAVRPLEAAQLLVVQAFEARYEALKRERNALDFEDLQTATLRLLESHPAVAAHYRDRFAMVMIDEFQDTNGLQLAIAEHITSGNLCTVGDENQSIYAFRHADIQVFRGRAHAVERYVALDTNYRIDPPLLHALNGLFCAPALFGAGHMSQREPGRSGEPPQGARASEDDAPEVFQVRLVDWSAPAGRDRHAVEATAIAKRCEELVAEGFAPSQIAVLMAAMRGGRAEAVERALTARGVPAYLSTGGSFFECREVAEVRAFLRVVDNVRDDEALAIVLGGRITGLSADALFAIGTIARGQRGRSGRRRRPGGLWSALDEAGELIGASDRATLARAVETIEWARHQRGFWPIAELVTESLLRLDFDLTLLASGHGGSQAWANVLRLTRMAEEFGRVSGADLRGFIEYLALRQAHATGEREATLQGEGDAVRVMSIHAAKGLEFPAVVVGSLSRSGVDMGAITWGRVAGVPLLGMRLPGEGRSIATASSLAVQAVRERTRREEAQRLLYVACTRAERSLTLVGLTDPGKDADGSLLGLVRRALGMGVGGSVSEGTHKLGEGRVTVRIVDADPPAESPAAALPPACDEPLVPLPQAIPAVFPQTASAPGRVSYTGLALYARCPYRFYLTHVARLAPPPDSLLEGRESRTFGNAVHAALERCATQAGPSEGALEAIASAHGLQPDAMPRLRSAVSGFLTSAIAEEVFTSDRVMHEVPMTVPLHGVVLAGAVDLIAWRGRQAFVVDYKTGAGAPSSTRAEERYRLQAGCYALAALAAGAPSVRVVIAELETGRTTEYRYTSEDRRRIEESIGATVDQMAAGAYAPRPTYDSDCCEACPGLGGLCPVRPARAGGAA